MNEEIKIDEQKATRLIRRIIVAERKNIKSQAKTDIQMVKEIQKIIEEELKCY